MLLEKYYLTQLPFTPIPLTPWMDMEGFISYCLAHPIQPLARIALLSDGSLVKSLRALYLSDVSVDVKDQKSAEMGLEMVKFLDSAEGTKAIVRDAWLCCGGRKLVYAHSFIDSSHTRAMIQREIHKRSKPVGMLLGDYNLPLLRDQLFIVRLKSDSLASEFALRENIFWARCYRLKGSDGFNAAIFEIFSPDLFDQ